MKHFFLFFTLSYLSLLFSPSVTNTMEGDNNNKDTAHLIALLETKRKHLTKKAPTTNQPAEDTTAATPEHEEIYEADNPLIRIHLQINIVGCSIL